MGFKVKYNFNTEKQKIAITENLHELRGDMEGDRNRMHTGYNVQTKKNTNMQTTCNIQTLMRDKHKHLDISRGKNSGEKHRWWRQELIT